ncbi:MAG: hypothetical protein JWN44_6452 [Myxococcales bacterium]|nr:hypothetical protein [Myxococcales bacterium]
MRRFALQLSLTVLLAAGCHRDVVAPAAAVDAGQAKLVRTVRVTRVRGSVMRQLPDGTSLSVKAGDQLAADDSLATDDGTANLDVGGVADVEVAAQTRVSIGELTDTLSKVRLRDGRIGAVVHGDARRVLQVDVPGSSAVASASSGEFSMLSTGSQVTVATRSGQVTLSARGRSVRIGSGQLSIVEHDQPPTAPQVLPPALILKLGAARAVTQRGKNTTVRGTTGPGAVVSINGIKLTADAHGEFSATVPLHEGANTLMVESSDALGRRQRAAWPRVTVDTSAPETKTKVEW